MQKGALNGLSRIRLKMNALVDEQGHHDALYRVASRCADRVVVRGICALRPGAQGIFGKHRRASFSAQRSRALADPPFPCHQTEFWIGSADRDATTSTGESELWRNPRLAARLDELFESLDPCARCWELGPDGQWTASPARKATSVPTIQESLMERHRS